MCIYDVYRYFEMPNCIIEIFFYHFLEMFYFGGPNAVKYFLEKCFYMHDQTMKILF